MKRSATVAELPPGYEILRPAAEADNGCLCRHVRVRKSATLRDVKCAVLKGYEDQYAPDDIKLFTRKYEDDAAVVRTDRTCATRLLSYGPDWHDCAVGDRGPADTVLLVASAMNEEENELLVLPAVHPMPQEQVERDLAPPPERPLRSLSTLKRVAAQSELFDPLPLPAHRDDWLAQYREATQTVTELLESGPKVSAGRNVIYLQPLVTRYGGGAADAAAAVPAADAALFAGLAEYLAAYYHGTPVKLNAPVFASVDKARRRAKVLGKDIGWRNVCPWNGAPQPQGQLCAADLLHAIQPHALRGGGSKGRSGGGAMGPDGFCVLGFTMTDLYIGDDDIFTGGLASPGGRGGGTGVFSFHRYRSGEGADPGVLLARAAKTAAHEIAHMYGIGHCLHRSCLMNGCGHLDEDFCAAPVLCPVDLSKFAAVLGSSFDPIARYRALLAFCESRPSGFAEPAAWYRTMLARLDGQASAKAPAAAAPATARDDDTSDEDEDDVPLRKRLQSKKS